MVGSEAGSRPCGLWSVACALVVASAADHLLLLVLRCKQTLASHTLHPCNPSNTQNYRQLALRLRELLQHTHCRVRMSPARNDASISSDEDIPTFPAPPTSKETTQIPLQGPAEGETMEGNSMAGITQVQKQALIDNIQLERMGPNNTESRALY